MVSDSINTHKVTPKKGNISSTDWLVLIGLILLSIVPMLGGTFRIVQLSSGAEITESNARFFASPLPVIIHIISSSLYAVLGAMQFPRGLRRWKRNWHRNIGNFLVPIGLAVALSGLWMTLFYPWPEGDGEILYVMRLIVGTTMTASIVLGYLAARKRDFIQHGNWMMRAYALAMGAGTQVFTHLPWFISGGGTPDELSRAMMMGAGWLINILIAEWLIRRRPQRSHNRNKKV